MSNLLKKYAANLFVLVDFFKDNTFSVLRLKDALTPNTTNYIFNEDFELSSWDPNLEIKSRYGDNIFPTRFL